MIIILFSTCAGFTWQRWSRCLCRFRLNAVSQWFSTRVLVCIVQHRGHSTDALNVLVGIALGLASMLTGRYIKRLAVVLLRCKVINVRMFSCYCLYWNVASLVRAYEQVMIQDGG